jgi:uncharacterized protein YycO
MEQRISGAHVALQPGQRDRSQRSIVTRVWADTVNRRLLPAILIALFQGCATQLSMRSTSASESSEAPSTRHALLFQQYSIAPASTDAFLSSADLKAGDIILTSRPGLVSAGIQLLTLAPVSHAAIYVGGGKIVEAVGSGVRARPIGDLVEEVSVGLVLRHPELTAAQARDISDYALRRTGTAFNFLGVTLHVPYSVKRRVCELPLVPSAVRDACLRGIGMIHYLAASERQLFCSQLILQAYQQAGLPITDADPRLISPADILHMREHDVPSVRIRRQLRYVGHLKYPPATIVAFEQ